MNDQQELSRGNKVGPGNIEENATIDLELETMIFEMEHYEEGKRSEAVSVNAELQEACTKTGPKAHQRDTPSKQVDTARGEAVDDLGSSSSSTRKRLFDNLDDEERELEMMNADRYEEKKRKALKIEEDRISIEQHRVEQEEHE